MSKHMRKLVFGMGLGLVSTLPALAGDPGFPEVNPGPITSGQAAAERILPLAVRNQLQTQRQQVARKGWNLQVGYTPATNHPELCGSLESTPQNRMVHTNPSTSPSRPHVPPHTRGALASAVSWKDYLLPVGSQGRAGSCWAFAVKGGCEAANTLVWQHSSQPLSAQVLLDCSSAGTICGGYTDRAAQWLVGRELPDSRDYPYAATDHSCPAGYSPGSIVGPAVWAEPCRGYTRHYTTFRPHNWWRLPANDGGYSTWDTIKGWVSAYGPVVTQVYADSYWQNYQSGVLEATYQGNQTNHAVLIVGYDDRLRAWLVRNSWSTGWGIQGYAWVRYGANNLGKNCIYIQ